VFLTGLHRAECTIAERITLLETKITRKYLGIALPRTSEMRIAALRQRICN
jgi:hypothetical protein